MFLNKTLRMIENKMLCGYWNVCFQSWKLSLAILHDFLIFKLLALLDAGKALRVHLAQECRTYQLQAAIFQEALLSCVPMSNGARSKLFPRIFIEPCIFAIYLCIYITLSAFLSFSDQSSLSNGTIKKKAAHAPLMSRPTERKN